MIIYNIACVNSTLPFCSTSNLGSRQQLRIFAEWGRNLPISRGGLQYRPIVEEEEQEEGKERVLDEEIPAGSRPQKVDKRRWWDPYGWDLKDENLAMQSKSSSSGKKRKAAKEVEEERREEEEEAELPQQEDEEEQEQQQQKTTTTKKGTPKGKASQAGPSQVPISQDPLLAAPVPKAAGNKTRQAPASQDELLASTPAGLLSPAGKATKKVRRTAGLPPSV